MADLDREPWWSVLKWHEEALRLGRAQRLPMVILEPAMAPVVTETAAADPKSDALDDARRRFATH